jgi:hypothetical protein
LDVGGGDGDEASGHIDNEKREMICIRYLWCIMTFLEFYNLTVNNILPTVGDLSNSPTLD